jgi:hypothetical protein
MKPQDVMSEEDFEECATKIMFTGMGFEDEGLYFVRLKHEHSAVFSGVAIGIHYPKIPAHLRDEFFSLVERIYELGHSA